MRPGLGLLRCFLTFLLSLSHPCSGVRWQGRFWRGEALGKPSGCDWDAAQDAAAFPGAPDSLSHPAEPRSHFALDLGKIPAQQLLVGVWGCLLGWVMSRCGAETGLLLWVTRKGENNPRTQSNCRKILTKKTPTKNRSPFVCPLLSRSAGMFGKCPEALPCKFTAGSQRLLRWVPSSTAATPEPTRSAKGRFALGSYGWDGPSPINSLVIPPPTCPAPAPRAGIIHHTPISPLLSAL